MNFNLYDMFINPLNELSHSTNYFDIVCSILLMVTLYSLALFIGYFFFKVIFWFFDHTFLRDEQSQVQIVKKSFIPKHMDMTPIFLYSYSGITNNMVEPIEVDDTDQLEEQINEFIKTVTVSKEIYDKYEVGDTCHANYAQCIISKKIEEVIIN